MERFSFESGHPVLNAAPHSRKTDPQPGLHQFADRSDSLIAQFVGIIRFGLRTVVQPDNFFHHLNYVVLVERAFFFLRRKVEALIELKPPYRAQIIAVEALKHRLNERTGVVGGGQISRPQSFVEFHERLIDGFGAVSLDCFRDVIYFPGVDVFEFFQDSFVRFQAENPKKLGYRRFALPVNFNVNNAAGIRFKFNPAAAVGNDFRAEKFLAPENACRKINAGRTNELGNDHSFHAVYDERPSVGHYRKLPQINFLSPVVF